MQKPITSLTIYGDSELVIEQLRGEYSVQKERVDPLPQEGRTATPTIRGS